MKDKNIFSFSLPTMKECFKMYWYIPALSFVMYFFAGIFPILSNLKRIPEIEYYVEECLDNLSLIYMVLLLAVPVITASLMMGFLHNQQKSMMIHALPISKGRLFNTYYLSGWILCQIPIVLMGLIYIAIAAQAEAIYVIDVCGWVLTSAAIITFFYAISVFTGTLTGTTIMNLIGSGIIMVIIPLIMSIARGYCRIFIAGFYSFPDAIVNIVEKVNPLLAMISAGSALPYRLHFIYLGIAVLISISAKMIYKTRKLELVGSSVLSKAFEELCTYLVVFVGMSSFGLLAWSFTMSRPLIIVGMFAGTLFTFVLAKIAVNRTVKIWNKSLLYSFAGYMCIAAIFVAVTVFDITGSQASVPDVGEVESVVMDDIITGYTNEAITEGNLPNSYYKEGSEKARVLSSPEAVAAIVKLHQYIVDNKNYNLTEDALFDDDEGASIYDSEGNEVHLCNEYITIRYNLKNGNEMIRDYEVILDEKTVELINDIVTCEEFVEKNKITSYVDTDKISYLTIVAMQENHDGINEETTLIDDKTVIDGIIEAWEKDISNSGYKENNRSNSDYWELGSIEIYFEKSKPQKENSSLGYAGSSNSYNKYSSKDELDESDGMPMMLIWVKNIDENLLEYLKSIGYEGMM